MGKTTLVDIDNGPGIALIGINLFPKPLPRVLVCFNVAKLYKVPIVITSLGARPELNDAIHSYGGITLRDIINNRFAHKAIKKGADGLIAVAAGTGGHAGTLSPLALI